MKDAKKKAGSAKGRTGRKTSSSKKAKKSPITKFGAVKRVSNDILVTPFKVYGFQGTSTVLTDSCNTQVGCGIGCNARTWTTYYC